MYLKSIELSGFKSFGKKTALVFTSPIASIVGPNGSGKSNVAEAFRFVLGEQSMKSMRSKKGEDLIWGGSPALSRANRAGVKVTFDNSTRLLDMDFSEVTIERSVYRDGLNEYLLNGTQVRLKDVIRLLAGANIGGSGYQIISQGEADRILNASPRERREMLEDALGLKLYQHKKIESERKLEETALNLEKTASLRREIAPHLRFLRSQVEKIERAREQREDLAARLNEYLAREHAWITQEDARISDDEHAHERVLQTCLDAIADARKAGDPDAYNVSDLERSVSEFTVRVADARRERERLARELGRAEGALEANHVTVEAIVAVPHVRGFFRDIEIALADIERATDVNLIRSGVSQLRSSIRSFVDGLENGAPVTNAEARQQVANIQTLLQKAQETEMILSESSEMARQKIARIREQRLAAERDIVQLEANARDAQSKRDAARVARAAIVDLKRRFEDEVREGIALVGAAIHSWERSEIPYGALSEDRSMQEKRRRDIERLKIKIEESGIGNGDAVIKEFKQTKERDEFLEHEIIDLEKSAVSLRGIITDLEKTIDARFHEGLIKINESLALFFHQLFGGGHAMLELERPNTRAHEEDDDNDSYDDADDAVSRESNVDLSVGLSISVALPRKKVRGLEALSGGERALTSIALIFSMSRVNPPPFLILDETDAALDEANSRRYADMIRELGKHSQLIVITHNRATMAAAGELYGITMGQDGVSRLLSVKLEDAQKVAK